MSHEVVSPDSRPPYSVRTMEGAAGQITHVVGRDGWSIIATINRPEAGTAHLISAAPDLYEALKALTYGDERSVTERFRAAETALAKAEGR